MGATALMTSRALATHGINGLNDIASRKGLFYGCAVKSDTLKTDATLVDIVLQMPV